MTKSCSGTWRHTTGLDYMFARREWKFSKESYRRPGRGRKGQIHSASWLRHPSLIMVLISLDLALKSENFENFGAFWKFFVKLQVFARGVVSPRVRPLVRIARNFENLAFLERACKEKNYQYLGEAWFWDLSLQKLKIHQKNDFLPTFWVAESDLGRIGFWGVKSTPNPEIPLGMESRQTKLSNEPSCTWFGPVEPTQK